VPRRVPVLAATALLSLGLAACSSAVAPDELEEQAAAALEGEIGARPDVSCPDELPAEMGATTECAATAGEEDVRLELTVTSVDGDEVRFDIESIG
jgi:Domain of unknown function (DUF4333)